MAWLKRRKATIFGGEGDSKMPLHNHKVRFARAQNDFALGPTDAATHTISPSLFPVAQRGGGIDERRGCSEAPFHRRRCPQRRTRTRTRSERTFPHSDSELSARMSSDECPPFQHKEHATRCGWCDEPLLAHSPSREPKLCAPPSPTSLCNKLLSLLSATFAQKKMLRFTRRSLQG